MPPPDAPKVAYSDFSPLVGIFPRLRGRRLSNTPQGVPTHSFDETWCFHFVKRRYYQTGYLNLEYRLIFYITIRRNEWRLRLCTVMKLEMMV